MANIVDLSHLPNPKTEYNLTFDKLTGGLNLYAPDYQLKLNESPDMENMLWKNGALCSRFGQSKIYEFDAEQAGHDGLGLTCFHELFHGYAFLFLNGYIQYGKPEDPMTLTVLSYGVLTPPDWNAARGTFFRYGEDLLYKAKGAFFRIHYTGDASAPFTMESVFLNAYTPVIYINADSATGAGTPYQPENRISPTKTIWYNAGTEDGQFMFSYISNQKDTPLPSDAVYVTDVLLGGAAFGDWLVANGTLYLGSTAPSSGTVTVYYKKATTTYQLPVTGASLVSIEVDGEPVEMQMNPPFTYDSTSGLITFTSDAPPVHDPFVANTVRITYRLFNQEALNSIADCCYATVFGGGQELCIVLGGCEAQPNAFFWNGHNGLVMDPSYWPMEQYNLGGDASDRLTGLAVQQGNLIVFHEHSVGKGSMNLTTLTGDTAGRKVIEIDYTNINRQIGCDLPWSIQLVENNLVFCNTLQGVHLIQDSSAAYENNIICISRKVNGDVGRPGLLAMVRGASLVSSFDDTHRYWVLSNDGRVFCWDYELSPAKDPSWFYLTGIDAPALCMDGSANVYHITHDGCIVAFDRTYADFGEGYTRRYRFATQYFHSYDRLKTVTVAIFSLRADTNFDIKLTYHTDYENRDDLTNLICRTWRLVPRDLSFRSLAVYPFAFVARRRPGCRHIRHFAMTLTCDGVGHDMPLLSAQVLYKYEGRDR